MTVTQCASKTAPDLPKDILGINIGMNKEDAEQRLREIGKFERADRKRQQVWSLRNNPHFVYLSIGYDENDQVRYVTAIAKPKGGQPMRYSDVGDISTAKKEIVEPNYRYIWQVPANENALSYHVIVQGTQPEVLSLYTLSKLPVIEHEEKQ